jgi:hypothetical protein
MHKYSFIFSLIFFSVLEANISDSIPGSSACQLRIERFNFLPVLSKIFLKNLLCVPFMFHTRRIITIVLLFKLLHRRLELGKYQNGIAVCG